MREFYYLAPKYMCIAKVSAHAAQFQLTVKLNPNLTLTFILKRQFILRFELIRQEETWQGCQIVLYLKALTFSYNPIKKWFCAHNKLRQDFQNSKSMLVNKIIISVY
jgi:hypothetical protein